MKLSRRDLLGKFFSYLPIIAVGSITFPFIRFIFFSEGLKKVRFLMPVTNVVSHVVKINKPPMFIIKNNNKWLALDSHCTHMGCIVNYDPKKNIFICPCHGSEYNITGKDIRGPTKKPLYKEPIRIVNNEIIIEYIYYKIS